MSIFLKQITHDRLFANIKNNLERYRSGNFDDLIGSDDCFSSDRVSIDLEALNLIKGADKNDTNNALIMEKAISGLSPHAARDKRFWTKLTHTHLLNYTRKRFPIPDESKGNDRAINHIINHFFANTGRGFERDNAPARLWWVVFMCKRAPHLPLKKALGSIYLYQDPIVQLLGRPTSAISVNLFNSILEKMVDSFDGDRKFLKERAYNRSVLKELSAFGGYNLLDALSIEDSKELIESIDNKLSNIKVSNTNINRTGKSHDEGEDTGTDSFYFDEEEHQPNHDDIVVILEEDKTLRDKLVAFGEDVIRPKFPNTDESERIMSQVMLIHWLVHKPRSHDEFFEKFNQSVRQSIAEDERIFIDDICQIIDEHF